VPPVLVAISARVIDYLVCRPLLEAKLATGA